jgi:hypothetical protein
MVQPGAHVDYTRRGAAETTSRRRIIWTTMAFIVASVPWRLMSMG